MELISREEAIRCVKENSYCLGGDLIEINGYCAVKDIEELPAIESRPNGKWKHLGETIKAVTLEMHQCSECGYVVLTRSEFNQESYCPNCGADMRGKE